MTDMPRVRNTIKRQSLLPHSSLFEFNRVSKQSASCNNIRSTSENMAPVHYDDSRIQQNHDKKLLERLKKYFDAFTTGDFDGVRNVESEGYTITNIRKRRHIRFQCQSNPLSFMQFSVSSEFHAPIGMRSTRVSPTR